ncbi:hypothetical protein OIU78_002672 [Salix suchowensis]|nr:hypothetical protein OIU78_002672 [Salix suchowensis]
MASISLPKHSLPSVLPTHKPRTSSSHKHPILSKSSQSQFYGLKLSHSTSLSIPSSSSSVKTAIFAKVNKGTGAAVLHFKRSGWKDSVPRQIQREACDCLLLPC